MKKAKFFTSILLTSVILSACGGESKSTTFTDSSSVDKTAKETKAPTEELVTEKDLLETTSAALETNSISASNLDVNWDIPEKMVKAALLEIGVNETDILSLAVKDANKSSFQLDATFLVQTDLMELEADIVYYETLNTWSVIWIINSSNQHIYYLEPSLAGTMDLYQYPSDKLITPATSSLEQHSQELETIWESLDEKNDAALSSIAEKYKIN